MTASDIIDQFGGTSKLADHLGVPVSTVDSWKTYNFIPRWRQAQVLDAAHRLNMSISTTDFPQEADRRPKKAAA